MYRESGVAPQLRSESIALAPTQFLHRMQAHDPAELFEQNSTVGYMLHSGGYVVDKGMGGYSHSKEVSIFETAAYEETVASLVDTTIRAELRRRGATPVAVDVEAPRAQWVSAAIQKPGDGHDNVNIPYRELVMPARLPAQAAEANGADVLNGVTTVVIPVVTYYYAHNTGWYYGQTWGSTAGCRARVALVLYDANGRLQGTSEFDTWHLSDSEYQPNGAEILRLQRRCNEQIQEATTQVLKTLW